MTGFRTLFGRHLKDYQANARARGIDWRLTVEEFKAIVSLRCHYCGAGPKRLVRKCFDGPSPGVFFKSKERLNGIDRIDANKPYELSNCVAACKRCNQSKNNMTPKQFLTWAIRVVAHLGGL